MMLDLGQLEGIIISANVKDYMPLTSIMRSVKLISLGGFECPKKLYKRIKDDKIEGKRKAMTATFFLISLSDMKSFYLSYTVKWYGVKRKIDCLITGLGIRKKKRNDNILRCTGQKIKILHG